MVNGEICIGLFALRDIMQVCLQPPLTSSIFVCVCVLLIPLDLVVLCCGTLLLLWRTWKSYFLIFRVLEYET